jgi:hypothetical protein
MRIQLCLVGKCTGMQRNALLESAFYHQAQSNTHVRSLETKMAVGRENDE